MLIFSIYFFNLNNVNFFYVYFFIRKMFIFQIKKMFIFSGETAQRPQCREGGAAQRAKLWALWQERAEGEQGEEGGQWGQAQGEGGEDQGRAGECGVHLILIFLICIFFLYKKKDLKLCNKIKVSFWKIVLDSSLSWTYSLSN